ncbi:phosphotransferase [Chloroflexi bacterium TSY]|nr:phosphotransferase [Chloroflexi bacterium TSY]
MSPNIENPSGLELSASMLQILLQMFSRYRRVIVRREFARGLSGGRVIEVRPIKADGTPELPVVVKLATISQIQKEWQAYRAHIQHRLPDIPDVREQPILLPKIGWGGICYRLMGGGEFEVLSLEDYCRMETVSAAQIRQTTEQLIRIMRPIWSWNREQQTYILHSGYDHLLPVNLLIDHQPTVANENDQIITPSALPAHELQPGDRVQIRDFVVHKVNRTTSTITLHRPNIDPLSPAYFVRCRSPLAEGMAACHANEIRSVLAGTVLDTRLNTLRREVWRAFDQTIDPDARSVRLPEPSGLDLPNPLRLFPEVLNHRSSIKRASIHGDFNLDNILIEPETGSINIIDFSEAREDHILHDLLRLETEITTKILPDLLYTHQLPPTSTLTALYWHLHQPLSSRSPAESPVSHPILRKPAVVLDIVRRTAREYLFDPDDVSEYYRGLFLYLLGALKFKNLNDPTKNQLPKKLAFWGAAISGYYLKTLEMGKTCPPESLMPTIDWLTSENRVTSLTTKVHNNGYAQNGHLASEEKILNALPLDQVPPRSLLLPRSRMPIGRNPLFVGRNDDLRQLARILKGGATVAIGQIETAATTGTGGMGKTQLASEFVHRYGQFFAGGVYWLSFADPKAVPAEIAACGGADMLGLRADYSELSLDEQVRLVQAAWQEAIPRLLIFDNCEDPTLVERWRPTAGGCRVLITARRASWDPQLGIKTLALDVLARSESLALLRKHYPDAADSTLDAIAEELGDLPLALHLAGSYLTRYRYTITPEKYLEQLRNSAVVQHKSLCMKGVSPTEHMQNVARTIALSYDQLDGADSVDA